MTIIFTILSIFVVSLQLLHFYFYGKGDLKKAYPIAIVVFSGFLVLETMLALNDPSQFAILLFNICNLWGLFNAIKGFLRLKKEGTT